MCLSPASPTLSLSELPLSLAALDSNSFFEGNLNYAAILDTARDVASAMAHIHSAKILHADLKASNILLKSDVNDPRGFVAKVSDFGLALTMAQGVTHASGLFQGTLSHMVSKQTFSSAVITDGFSYASLSYSGTRGHA